MDIVFQTQPLRQQIRTWRQQGKRIGFVPTMGNLHQGHLQLVEQAKQHADVVVVSIFVNPMQFDRPDDLDNYPRTFEQDQSKLANAGVTLLFAPTADVIYPKGTDQQTIVEVPGLSDKLEGASRPGHFRGVATIVAKLFNLVQPDVACFGEKDYQQLAVIRQMTRDLAIDTDIMGVATVRDEDGLAKSSRNGLLTTDERRQAPLLAQQMNWLAQQLTQTSQTIPELTAQVTATLNRNGFITDCIDIVDADNLSSLSDNSDKAVILMAAFLGKARLIDNLVVALH